MKIKADFVTNSSYTMYVISFDEKFLRKCFDQYFTLRTGEYFRLFDDKIKLIKYTQQKDVDWITEATKMPLKFWGMGKEEFKEAISILDEGKFAAYVVLERKDYERLEKAEDIIRENGGHIRLIGGD